MGNPKREKVLALIRGQRHHIEPVETLLDIPIVYDELWDKEKIIEIQPTLLMLMSDDNFEGYFCVEEARKRGIPSLSVMDGILEWRNIWENPRYGVGGNSLNKQLIGTDKIACVGPMSARILESWGSLGKCELVGIPRLDKFINNQVQEKDHRIEGNKRLLIATAKKAAFTQRQMDEVLQGLKDLKQALTRMPEWKCIWRLTSGLDKELEVKSDIEDFTGADLYNVLTKVDAIITTPSTTILEAMAAGIPTVVLDYGNYPTYQYAAWKITCEKQIIPALEEIYEPSSKHLLYQEQILKDSLSAPGRASQRLAKLIEVMSHIGFERSSGKHISIPPTILESDSFNNVALCDNFDLTDLYPNHSVFGKGNLPDKLRELQALREENNFLRAKLEKGSFSRLLTNVVRKLFKP